MTNKKIKWTLIGLGIFVLVLIVIAISFFVFIFIAVGIDFFSKDLTPETKIPTKIEEPVSEEEFEKPLDTKETPAESEIFYKPTVKVEIFEGPTKESDIYFVRVKAVVTGNPAPTIGFNLDDAKSAWGEDIVQVNLIPYAGYLLKANASNSEGSDSTNILLMIDDNGNLIKLDKDISEDLIIDDLAYIKILCLPYTDNADQETDGISIDISFYNSKSKIISFDNIPIDINIKLYATRFNWDTGEDEIIKPPVYEGIVEIDHSMRLSKMFGNYIKIPFEKIEPLPDEESTMGISIVTVITPLQGKFEAKEEWIPLDHTKINKKTIIRFIILFLFLFMIY